MPGLGCGRTNVRLWWAGRSSGPWGREARTGWHTGSRTAVALGRGGESYTISESDDRCSRISAWPAWGGVGAAVGGVDTAPSSSSWPGESSGPSFRMSRRRRRHGSNPVKTRGITVMYRGSRSHRTPRPRRGRSEGCEAVGRVLETSTWSHDLLEVRMHWRRPDWTWRYFPLTCRASSTGAQGIDARRTRTWTSSACHCRYPDGPMSPMSRPAAPPSDATRFFEVARECASPRRCRPAHTSFHPRPPAPACSVLSRSVLPPGRHGCRSIHRFSSRGSVALAHRPGAAFAPCVVRVSITLVRRLLVIAGRSHACLILQLVMGCLAMTWSGGHRRPPRSPEIPRPTRTDRRRGGGSGEA